MAQYIECPRCGAHLDHGETCDCQNAASKTEPAPRRMPSCRDCGKKFIEVDAYVEEAARQNLDMRSFLRGDPCYNSEKELFLCPDCWEAAGQPMEMVEVEPPADTGLIVRPNCNPEVIAADADSSEEDIPQSDEILYSCKHCGQSSFTPGCACDGAEAEQRREAAEHGRESAHRLIAELLFSRFTDRGDDGYKSDPTYKMLVGVVDSVIDNGIVKATLVLDFESKLNISVKELQVQIELVRTLKTARTASTV